jgi:hypothetical protein
VWIGNEQRGGYYVGAMKVGTVEYEEGKNPYIFPDIKKIAKSVQIQGSPRNITFYLSLSEIEVYGEYDFLTFHFFDKVVISKTSLITI